MLRERHSFTVLELVFAVAITSLLTLATLRICGQSLDVVDTLVDAHSLHNEAEKAFNYLEADLKNLSLRHEGEYAEAVMEYAPDSIAHKMKNENGEEVTDNYSNRGLYLISQVAGQDGKLRKALVHYRLLRRGQSEGFHALSLSRSVLGSSAFVQHNGKGGIPQTGISTRLFLSPIQGNTTGGTTPYFIKPSLERILKILSLISRMLVLKINPEEGSLSLKGRLDSQEAFSKIAGIPQQTVYSQRQNKRVPFNQTWFEDTENIVASNVLDLEINPVISAGYLGLEQSDLNKGLNPRSPTPLAKWTVLSTCENAQGSGPALLLTQLTPGSDTLKTRSLRIDSSQSNGSQSDVTWEVGSGMYYTPDDHIGVFVTLGLAVSSIWLITNAEFSPMKHATTAWEKQQSYNTILAIEKISHFKVKLTLVSPQHMKKLNDPNLKMDFETFKKVYGITFHKNILAQH